MEALFIALMITTVSIAAAFILLIMFWYNGVLEVRTDEDGDSLKLNIDEYDMVKKRKLMIFLVKKVK